MANVPLTTRPPLPPFTHESAIQKVRLAEDGWNTRDPEKVVLAYAIDSRWRNRSEFIAGRGDVMAFLWRKWGRELDYRLIKEMWAFTAGTALMATRTGSSNDDGLMASRFASINDLGIVEADRKYRWSLGRR